MAYRYCRVQLKPLSESTTESSPAVIIERTKAFCDAQGLTKYRVSLYENELSLIYQTKSEVISAQTWHTFLATLGMHVDTKIEQERIKKRVLPGDEGHHAHHHHHHHHAHDSNHWVRAGLGLGVGAVFLGLSLAGIVLPAMVMVVLTGVSLLTTLYLGWDVYQAAWQSLKQKKWNTATLYALSTLTLSMVSIASWFVPGLTLMHESAPLILGFWHLGEAIEHWLLNRLSQHLDVRDCVPAQVSVLCDEQYVPMAVEQAMPNDVIRLAAHDVIPLDGVLLSPALLRTTRVDGSPSPKYVLAGESVQAGMVLLSPSTVNLRVATLFQNSYLSRIAKNMKQSKREQAPVEAFAARILKYFVPALLIVAVISSILVGIFFTPALAVQTLVTVLVSACPCALSLITPMAVKIGMKKAAEQGIQFHDGKILQTAADIDTVVFDLNGTLTMGTPSVATFHVENNAWLPMIAALEDKAQHPVAATISAYIKTNYAAWLNELPMFLSEVDASCHAGITAKIDDCVWMIGSQKLLARHGITVFPRPYHDANNGAIYVVRGTTVVGQIAVQDPLRPDAIQTIRHLQAMGKGVHICTGAGASTARQYAQQLNVAMEDVASDRQGTADLQKNESKKQYIESLQRTGHRVAMVGDAVNDLEAMSAAHVGIGVHSDIGDAVVANNAGISVSRRALFPIASAFELAKATKHNIVQNLSVSLGYNALITLVGSGALLALGFVLNPVVGTILVIIESSLVLANLYRLKRQKIHDNLGSLPDSRLAEIVPVSTTERILHTLGQQDCPSTASNVPRKETPASVKPVSKPVADDPSDALHERVGYCPC